MAWAGQVACMKRMRNAYTILAGKPSGLRLFRNLGINIRIILKRSLIAMECEGTSGWRPVVGSCVQGNEPSCSIEGIQLLCHLSDC